MGHGQNVDSEVSGGSIPMGARGGRMAEQRGQLSRDDTRLPLPDYFCPAMELTWPTGGVLYAELAGSF